jgi:hypothetical protein
MHALYLRFFPFENQLHENIISISHDVRKNKSEKKKQRKLIIKRQLNTDKTKHFET